DAQAARPEPPQEPIARHRRWLARNPSRVCTLHGDPSRPQTVRRRSPWHDFFYYNLPGRRIPSDSYRRPPPDGGWASSCAATAERGRGQKGVTDGVTSHDAGAGRRAVREARSCPFTAPTSPAASSCPAAIGTTSHAAVSSTTSAVTPISRTTP